MFSIKHLFHIDAAQNKVFEALTTIDGLAKWWTIQTEGNPSIDGIITFGFGPEWKNQMKVTLLKEEQLVEWKCVSGAEEWIGNKITFALDSNDDKTRLRFSHEGWKEDGDFYAICNFSWARYLRSLRKYCETGTGEAFGSSTYQ